MEERRIEDGNVGQIGQHPAGHLDAQHRGRVVQGRQRSQVIELRQGRIVDDGRPVQIRAAVHHPVSDRDQSEVRQALSARCHHLERRPQRRLVIGDPAILADAFDDAVDQGHPGIGLHQ